MSNSAGGRSPRDVEDQISYLSSMMRRADQSPGKDAVDRLAELSKKAADLVPRWEKIVGEKYDASKVLMDTSNNQVISK